MDNTEIPSFASTEQLIILAAKKVFIRKGFAAARMQEIADEAGINKALVHYYFRNKEKLFVVIFKEAFQSLMPKVLDVFHQEGHFREKIWAFTAGYIKMILENPFIPAFVIAESNRDPDAFFTHFVAPPMQEAIGKMRGVIAQAVKRGEIRPIEPLQLMINLISLCVFPFAAKPMLQHLMNLSEEAWQQMQEDRITQVSEFILSAIEPVTNQRKEK